MIKINLSDTLLLLKVAINTNDKRKQEIILKKLSNRQDKQNALDVINHTINSYQTILKPWIKMKEMLERGK